MQRTDSAAAPGRFEGAWGVHGLIDRLTSATAVMVGNVYADGSAVTFSKGV